MPLKITRKDEVETIPANNENRLREHEVKQPLVPSAAQTSRHEVKEASAESNESTSSKEVPVRKTEIVVNRGHGHKVHLHSRSAEHKVEKVHEVGLAKTAATPLHDIAAQRSFTLYKKDCQLIRDVQVYFLQNGNHITESQVVRIALRALEISDRLAEMHTQIKSEDGRKHRGSAEKKAAV